MTINKINLDPSGVPKTLLLPLLGRTLFSKKSYSPFHDDYAVKLVDSLNYDFEGLLTNVSSHTLFWMARAYHFDRAITSYLKSKPNGIIVNLGAGLETAFYRVDNGAMQWIDLDLPEVIALRQKIFPPHNRIHEISKSILDYSWINDLKKYGDEFFFFAGGLFMYFKEEEVKSIFLTLANHFPGSELMFDSISERGMKYANQMLKQSNMKNALLQWGLNDRKKPATWSEKINLIEEFPYFKNLKTKSGFPFSMRFKMFFYDLLAPGGGMIRLKFF